MKKGLRQVDTRQFNVANRLNRDLMKKGLRLIYYRGCFIRQQFESRPYEEGIKTLPSSNNTHTYLV